MSEIKIFYEEFKGANAIYARMEAKEYDTVCRILTMLVAMNEDETVLEYMVTENKKLPKVSPKGRHKRPLEFIAGLSAKSLKEAYERDFTVKQLDYLNVILHELGASDVVFVHGKKPNPGHEVWERLMGGK